jgi:predicted nuclease of restriction endonuclease-like (RecB) superfamily
MNKDLNINDIEFKKIIENIKAEISSTQIQIMNDANKRLIKLYYYIGKIISDNATWGSNFLENLSRIMKIEYPNIKGFSVRNLKNMKKFYLETSKNEKVQMASALIPWSHNMIIIDKIDNIDERLWYIEQCRENGWSYNVLAIQIDTKLYCRQENINKINNFNEKLVEPVSDLANDLQKDPYIFNLPLLKEKYVETELENALVERIKDTILELGKGFSFVGNQYKLIVGDEDFYIDMLFYNLKLHSYVVVELKTGEFKPEYVGKVNFYINVVNELVKTDKDNDTIGLILCKEKNKLTVDYALSAFKNPIGVSSFEILPKEVLDSLPTEEDLNLLIDIDETEGENNESK